MLKAAVNTRLRKGISDIGESEANQHVNSGNTQSVTNIGSDTLQSCIRTKLYKAGTATASTGATTAAAATTTAILVYA